MSGSASQRRDDRQAFVMPQMSKRGEVQLHLQFAFFTDTDPTIETAQDKSTTKNVNADIKYIKDKCLVYYLY